MFRRFVESQPVLLELCGGNSWNAVLLLFASMYVTAATCWVFLSLRRTVLSQTEDAHDAR